MKSDDELVRKMEMVLARALWTFCESMLGFMAVGVSVFDIDWKTAISVSITAVIISVLKSIVVGMPEESRDIADE